MPEGSCADASYARRQTDDLTYRSPLPFRKAARFCKSQRAECKRSGPSPSGMLLPWIPTLKASDGKTRAPKRPNNVFSTEVETWKYHDESIRCPACGVKEVPIILKQQKFTSSRLAAFCLMGCWPFCFIPLLMRRDKSTRTLCPRCGYDYGICTRAKSKLIACSSKCAFSRGKLNDFANSRPCHLRAEYSNSRVQPGYRQKTLSMGDEAARALRVSEERPRREEEGGSRCCRSQSKLSHGYAFCANQVTNRDSSYDECSSDDYVNKRWDRRRDLDESKAPKARGHNEGSTGTVTVDFYARQVCCRECG
ncbi:PREDICTED: uncharacterized protein LOC105448911 isoform X2 [Wasmannia auropunctata]|uniref:uncharacterized protein LOC105448911 isoform X2 n=1 Tax=Wasmannia auropunctata TaxID=64793 RepID=UPI0005F08A54|nr:PREDICTED: uncharacterized protein LOC105448911 isoform X2 [Wasmannia auropunctata]XP_011686097.1 PREDICTED: uncharacterized protein LOC105448911 isoform X2 [Wasmannia auropunctata]